MRDVQYGIRMLLKTPGATITVLIALSLGIGLSALTYSVINGAVLTSLPVEGGDRIVRIDRAEAAPLTVEDYWNLSARQRSFEGLGAVEMSTVTLAIEGSGSAPVRSARVTPSIFPLLRVTPVLGRAFTDEDAAPGALAVVLLSHEVWRDQLGSDPDALGRVVRVDGRPAEVVGIMPDGFGFPWSQRVWSPLDMDPLRRDGGDSTTGSESAWVVGRLLDGVSTRSAAGELTTLIREFDARIPGEAGQESVITVVNYADLFNGDGRAAALAAMMLGVALLVLLVACANVANVLLARAFARRREVAIRLAVGASRSRIATQLLTEISLLAAAGAAGGVMIALVGTPFINAMLPAAGMPYWIGFRVDPPVLGFVVIVAALSALIAGSVPAMQASRSSTHELLKDDSRGASSFSQGRVMRRLIGVEMALSFVLLVIAGLFIRSALNFSSTEFDFEPEGVYSANIRIPESTYGDAAARVAFVEGLSETLGALPEVAAVTLATAVPGVGSAAAFPVVVDGAAGADGESGVRTRSIVVTPGFFAFFRAPLIAGREFDVLDLPGSLPVAIVNEAFAARYFPEGALDRRIRFAGGEGGEEWFTIVGVTSDLMAGGVERENSEAIYLPVAQNPPSIIRILARPNGGFVSLPAPIRESLASLDPDVALFDVRPLEEVIYLANSQYTWFSLLFLIAGGVALFLAAIGLYGVMAFWVSQRTREIGVRMALGGQRGDIVRFVLRQGMRQTAVGLVAGVVLAIPAAQLLGSTLFGVAPHDPLVFGAILGVLVAAAWLGCWLPARRATRVDPLRALAGE